MARSSAMLTERRRTAPRVAEPMPSRIAPMLAVLSQHLPADESNWSFEYKWDGVRVICYWDGRRLILHSRNLLDITRRYPELQELGAALGKRPVILDGASGSGVLGQQGVVVTLIRPFVVGFLGRYAGRHQGEEARVGSQGQRGLHCACARPVPVAPAAGVTRISAGSTSRSRVARMSIPVRSRIAPASVSRRQGGVKSIGP